MFHQMHQNQPQSEPVAAGFYGRRGDQGSPVQGNTAGYRSMNPPERLVSQWQLYIPPHACITLEADMQNRTDLYRKLPPTGDLIAILLELKNVADGVPDEA